MLDASLIFFALMLVGAIAWTLGGGALTTAAIASAIWGLGFAASNSMQQARLAAAAPAIAGAAIALNSSSIYVGQAAGSATGGMMFEAGALHRHGLDGGRLPGGDAFRDCVDAPPDRLTSRV